jgi:hypothetical protein
VPKWFLWNNVDLLGWELAVNTPENGSEQPLSKAAQKILSERALTGKPQGFHISAETLAWFEALTETHRDTPENRERRKAVAKRVS